MNKKLLFIASLLFLTPYMGYSLDNTLSEEEDCPNQDQEKKEEEVTFFSSNFDSNNDKLETLIGAHFALQRPSRWFYLIW